MGLDEVSPFKAYEGTNEGSIHHILLIHAVLLKAIPPC